jgi:hypothetical protein
MTPEDRVPPEHPSTRPGRALAPVVWLLAMGWLGLQGLGRGGMWLLTAVDEGTSAVARAGSRAGRAVLGALGPLGRVLLRRVLRPLWRGVRRLWSWLNRRVFLALTRPLGRFARWLVARARPVVAAVLDRARRVLARVEPGLDALGAVVSRAAVRLGAALRRGTAPVRRATAVLGRRVRAAGAAVTGRVRAVHVPGQGPRADR